jgi:hypothetical protein
MIQDPFDQEDNKGNIDPLHYEDKNLDNELFDANTNDDMNEIQQLSVKIKNRRVNKGKKRADPFRNEGDEDIKNEQDNEFDVFDFESRIPKDVLKVMKTVGISESVDTVSKKLTAEKKKRRRKKKRAASSTQE